MENNLRISSGSVSDRGLSDKRPHNEDSFLEIPQFGIYAVADGVGGAQAGEVASQMAMEILGEAFSNFPPGADAEAVMRSAVTSANAAIHEMAHELPQLASMATTVVALHLADNIATIGHVGDSRLYRVDREGNLHRETDDHSMVAEEVRAGRMTEEQAENHPSRNIISRALGAELNVVVDMKTIMVEPGTAFLICSDGITRHISDDEIKGVLTFGGGPADVCEYLKELCYQRGAEDNLTAVVIKTAAAEGAAVESSIAAALDADEETVASARMHTEMADNGLDSDSLLEVDTYSPMPADDEVAEEEISYLGAETVAFNDKETVSIDHDTDEAIQIADVEYAPAETRSFAAAAGAGGEPFSIFGAGDEAPAEPEQKSGVAGKIFAGLGMLVLGAAVGFGVFYFGLVPPIKSPTVAEADPFSGLQSENIAFSSFEKVRRRVDGNPEEYLKTVPTPEDAEGYYLSGRAYLLLGDLQRARAAFVEAQKRIVGSESVNAKVLATDIATGLLLANDLTLGNRLRNEIDASLKGPANANVNVNSNSNSNTAANTRINTNTISNANSNANR